MTPWDHPLIKKGMTAQLATRRARIAAGEKPLGWKVGLGAPATMQKMGLQAPLGGFLMQRALLLSGGTASLKGWLRPVAEPEICVRMARDLPGGATPEAALAAGKEILPAIVQRHVLRGGNPRLGGAPSGLPSRLIRRGVEAAATADPEALTGKLTDI